MANWAELPQDLLHLIAQHLKLLEDYVVFGVVCSRWRAVATKENFKGLPLWQGTPCLMLAADKDSDYREFYSLSEDEVVANIFLPETRGKRCMDASFGWFFTVGQEGETSLVNPFTREQIDLPHQNSMEDYEDQETRHPWSFYRKALLSSSPCENPTNFVLMVIGGGQDRLNIWKPGDRVWTRLTDCSDIFCDLVYHKNQFYGIGWNQKLVACDIAGSSPKEGRVIAQFPLHPYEEIYIMKSLGRFIVVVRDGVQVRPASKRPNGYLVYNPEFHSKSLTYRTNNFRAYEFDLVDEKWAKIQDLGDRALFLGHSVSVCIDQASRFPGIKANHIYFTDDFFESYMDAENGGGRDMGIFNVEDGNIIPHYKGQSLSLIGPPIWFTPCSHCLSNLNHK